MEFDKSRVYTALNADELSVGSRCIFSDTYGDLHDAVIDDVNTSTLDSISSPYTKMRFVDETYRTWYFAYLVSEPGKPQYCCYDTIDEAFKDIQKHGWWIVHKETGESFYVVAKTRRSLRIYASALDCVDLLNDHAFADDSTPCGKVK